MIALLLQNVCYKESVEAQATSIYPSFDFHKKAAWLHSTELLEIRHLAHDFLCV